MPEPITDEDLARDFLDDGLTLYAAGRFTLDQLRDHTVSCVWPKPGYGFDVIAGGHMNQLLGWRKVSCKAADAIRHGLRVSSALTDIDGQYGQPVIYTEWWSTTAGALLRDFLYDPHTGTARCVHYAPELRRLPGVPLDVA